MSKLLRRQRDFLSLDGYRVLNCRLLKRCRYVKRAMHGTQMLSWQELRESYGRELVSLRNEQRYTFLNTLFSVSEAVMYMQASPAPQQVGNLT